MRERDVHDLIEQQDPEHKQELLDKIKVRIAEENIFPQTQQNTEHKPVAAKKKNKLTLVIASVVTACLLCLAIVLPVTLTETKDRYCVDGDYVGEIVSYNIKEYSEKNNKNMLYLDLYDSVDTILTEFYYNVKDRNDMIFISEEMENGTTGELIKVIITDNKTRVDVLNKWNNCEKKSVICGVSVQTVKTEIFMLAAFEYNGFRYYLQVDNAANQNRVAELVEQMLAVK